MKKKCSKIGKRLYEHLMNNIERAKNKSRSKLAKAYNDSLYAFCAEPTDGITCNNMRKFIAEKITPKLGVDFEVHVKFVGNECTPDVKVEALNDYGKIFVDKMLKQVSRIS